jgi:hypothetical protein
MEHIFKWFCNNALSFGEGWGEVTPVTASNYSGILGCVGNTVSGYYSAILGGKGNLVTHNCAAAFGNGISSVAPNTFHVNCLNACDTPAYVGGLPPGTIFKSATPPPLGTPLYII